MPANMKTLSLDRRYETFSYLPPLTDQQIEKQLNYCLQMGYIPGVEFNASSNPEEFYWTMWKLPLFGASSTRAVLDEVQACRSEYGNCFIRVVGFDNVKQCQAVSFVVHKPGSNNSGSGFRY